ncbi:hypothetical protein MUO14_19815 [Halobacillus shinanisalinarum]|uniref:Uncharacterized protein n=1 Tax=Halobacillus shinanisalinarum TaxID=2932258 RepID=A0ABY4GX65_9BACI|nr:hypothetical protein [Halobacillus shinanisalinarum]UOQ92649.1 hypothetical protein MUO14_19815 [Halobacillus shinanisalinarum]
MALVLGLDMAPMVQVMAQGLVQGMVTGEAMDIARHTDVRLIIMVRPGKKVICNSRRLGGYFLSLCYNLSILKVQLFRIRKYFLKGA